MRLQQVLFNSGIKQAELARALALSPATVTQIIRHDRWPVSLDREVLQGRMSAALRELGAEESAISSAFEPAPDEGQLPSEEDNDMLYRKHSLSQEARQMFTLFGEPFAPVTDPSQVYLTPDIRYAREAMWHAAKNADLGTITAIVGESGSGKSTLRRDLKGRLAAAGEPVVVIEPDVEGMEESDKKGKPLRVGDIAAAAIHTLDPTTKVRMGQQARMRQLKHLLFESANAGNKHLLVIEEAHALPKATLRHLKRLVEMERGMRFLVSVVMIGQTELGMRLSETDSEIREVVQRCGVCTLNPLPGIESFLSHRLGAVGADLSKLITADGIAAIERRLHPTLQRGRDAVQVSLLYPLAVQNLFTACLNKAAELDYGRVDADIVAGV